MLYFPTPSKIPFSIFCILRINFAIFTTYPYFTPKSTLINYNLLILLDFPIS
nr:MAG TPA: hypothetical protein [Caudoviricetes sp.]